jgi:hypothetical protein
MRQGEDAENLVDETLADPRYALEVENLSWRTGRPFFSSRHPGFLLK